MSLNSTTCPLVNGTAVCVEPSSSTGLAVGLSLFFLLLVIVAALVVYTQRTRCGNMSGSRSSRSLKKEDDDEDNSQRYTMTRGQSSGGGQTPIYENFKVQTAGQGRTAIHMPPSDPEEDLYLQCDSPDEAIYSNDLACRLSMLPPVSQEEDEDLYIVPDAV